MLLRHMASLSLFLGILLMFVVIHKDPKKPLISQTLKVVLVIFAALFFVFIVWFGVHSPNHAGEMIGTMAGYVLIVAVFVFIGDAIRKKRLKKRDEKAPG